MYDSSLNKYVGFIYLMTNKINGKFYVGQTRQTVHRRMIEHKHDSKDEFRKSAIDNAIHKYGMKAFNVDILETFYCDSEDELINELNESEIYYIKEYDSSVKHSGYNISEGGGQQKFRRRPIDVYTIHGDFVKTYNGSYDVAEYYKIKPHCVQKVCTGDVIVTNNLNVVFRYSGEPFDKFDVESNLNRYKVYMFSSSGDFISSFSSCNEASDILLDNYGIKALGGNIANAAKNKRFAYGFYWNREPIFEYKEKVKKHKEKVDKLDSDNRFRIKVKQYDPKTKELIKIFSSISDAALMMNGKRSSMASIKRSCDGVNKYPVYGYIWRYIDDKFDQYEVKPERPREKSLDKYSLIGEYICTYENVHEAVENINVDKKLEETIIKCCQGKVYTSCGFVWRFSEDDLNKYTVGNPRLRAINCYSKDNEYLQTFESSNLAGKWLSDDDDFHHRANTIRACCVNANHCFTAYGYKWFYANDEKQPDLTKYIPRAEKRQVS